MLDNLFLAILCIKVGHAKVNVVGKPYEVSIMVDDINTQGLYVEETVAGVREFLEELYDSDETTEGQQEFIATVLDYLYQKPTNWRV